MQYLWPEQEQWDALRNYPDQTASVTMLNLLSYRETADYSAHPDEEPCSGRQAYRRYTTAALPCVEAVGGRVVYAGKLSNALIGPTEVEWDEMLLVEYPSVAAFLEMPFSAQYRAISYHRSAALKDSRLIPLFS